VSKPVFTREILAQFSSLYDDQFFSGGARYFVRNLNSYSNEFFCQENVQENRYIHTQPGTDVMIFKIFSLKHFAKKLAFFAQNKAKLCKNWIITLVFEKNTNFLPKIGKNRRKL
jgi:hypothetical protein